ncbi:MAG: MCE family protein [Bacteroidaceae bacterium]|nr:MCE family protein [Bacteroidaceae bacterium]
MNNKIKFSKELLVGVIGIIALLMIYLLINFFKGINLFKDGERYYVKFDNIGQMVNSSPVYLNGYKAGNVQGIAYDFKDMRNVIVTMDIDKRLQIPVGSYAEVNNHMLGGCDINIVLGDSDKFIAPGDTIMGKLNKGLMGEMGDALPAIQNIIPKVDSVLTSLNTLLGSPALNNSLNNAEHITEDLLVTTESLNKLLSTDIPQITSSLNEIGNNFQGVSEQLREVDYNELFASLQTTINNLENITTAIEKGEGTAGKLLKDSELYNKLDSTCTAANALLTDLKENPRRYVHFSVFGGKEK